MHLDPHAAVFHLGRVATQIALTDVIEAFASVDFKPGRVQGALHHPILHKALRQQGIGMGARVKTLAGPIALDLAYGNKTKKFRLDFSIAIAF